MKKRVKEVDKLKRIIALILSIAFISTLLVGCNSDANTNSKLRNEDDNEQMVIRMTWWGNQNRHNYTVDLIKLFEEKNPDIKIEYEYTSWDDYWQSLAPQAAAGTLPDIIQMDVAYLAEYVSKNQLADLTPFYDDGAIDVSDISDNFLATGQIDERYYGFPTGSNVMSFMYDPNMLGKIGLDEIPFDWTWDEYIEFSERALEEGLTFDVGLSQHIHFDYYLRTNGQRLFAEDGSGLGYDNDQLYIDFYTMVKERVDAGSTPTPDYMAQLSGQEEFPVVKGEGIGEFNWSSVSYSLEENVGSPIKLAPMPGPNISDGLFLKASMYFSIAENSEQKEAAARFINFFGNDLEANDIIKAERGVPGSKKVMTHLSEHLDGIQLENIKYVQWAEDNSSPMGALEPPKAGQVMDLIRNIYDEIMYEQISVEEAAKKFREEAENILN